MNNQDQNLALLPSGFVDLLPPDAEQEFLAISTLMEKFMAFGYSRVKPPLVEFEESLFAPGPGASLVNEAFRLMDPVSHKMMGLRPDITVQIARIASSRMAGEPRPLRLTYANDVLRIKPSQKRTERQFCQVGCEIVGQDDDEADIEICVVALVGLKVLGVKSVTLDLTMPRLLDKIFEEFKVEDQEALKQALSDRDVDRVLKLGPDVLVELLKASGPAGQALETLSEIDIAAEDLMKLKAVCEGVQKAAGELKIDVSITIDPVEHRDLEYHQGVAFSLFASGVRGELGRGGRYNIIFGNEQESAAGFTLYMDTVRTAMPDLGPKNIVFVPESENWETIGRLQDEGWVVMRATGKEKCSHEYKNGKPQEI